MVPPVHENESVTVRPPVPLRVPPLIVNDGVSIAVFTVRPPATISIPSEKVAAALSTSVPPVKRIPPFVAKVAPLAIVKAPDDRLMIEPALALSPPECAVCVANCRVPEFTRTSPLLVNWVGEITVVVPAPVFTKVPLFSTKTDWLVKFCQLISASSLIVKVPRFSRVVLPPLKLDSSRVAPLKLRLPSLISCRPPSRDLPTGPLMVPVASGGSTRLPVPVMVPLVQEKLSAAVMVPVPASVPPPIETARIPKLPPTDRVPVLRSNLPPAAPAPPLSTVKVLLELVLSVCVPVAVPSRSWEIVAFTSTLTV